MKLCGLVHHLALGVIFLFTKAVTSFVVVSKVTSPTQPCIEKLPFLSPRLRERKRASSSPSSSTRISVIETNKERLWCWGLNNQKASFNDEGEINNSLNSGTNRRRFLSRCVILVSSSLAVPTINAATAHAAMKSDQTTFVAGKDMTPSEAKLRFKEGQESLAYLLENYETICEGGGDNVRRYLGTVGTTSGLYGIAKVLKVLGNEAEDVVEFNEAAEEVNAALSGAEGSAYMAIFTPTSTSGVPPSKYFGDCKTEARRAQAKMQEIAEQLKIN